MHVIEYITRSSLKALPIVQFWCEETIETSRKLITYLAHPNNWHFVSTTDGKSIPKRLRTAFDSTYASALLSCSNHLYKYTESR